MQPALSVVFLTVLIGAAQGLFLALVAVDGLSRAGLAGPVAPGLLAGGSGVALVLLAAGLAASFFHLGHPERAWRAASQWRTSWLSREVIALPATMGLVALYGISHAALGGAGSAALGAAGAIAALALFVCTGMIYACIRFLPQWATPLTVIHLAASGLASGLVLASAIAAVRADPVAGDLALAALAATAAALALRAAALARNARLGPSATLASAIGVRHDRIRQASRGFTGSSFNTRDFFHGVPGSVLRAVKWGFLAGAFAAPLALVGIGLAAGHTGWLVAATGVQLSGLLVERWYFFAEAQHVQNVYYQREG